MDEGSQIISELRNLITRERLKKNIDDHLKICKPLYGQKHGGWESIVLSSILFDFVKSRKDCRVLFSLKSVPLDEMPEAKKEIAERYLKISKEKWIGRNSTEIDSLIVCGNQRCLIEHETRWKSLPWAIVQASRIVDSMKESTAVPLSCIFITHAHVHRYESDSNPIAKFAEYAETCERLFDKNTWAIVNIWDRIFDWRLKKIDVWWIPQDFSISSLKEKEKEAKIPNFWWQLGRL